MTLREWRNANGWTLKTAGKHLGISTTQLCLLERGGSSPTLRTVDRIERLTDGKVTRLDWPKEETHG